MKKFFCVFGIAVLMVGLTLALFNYCPAPTEQPQEEDVLQKYLQQKISTAEAKAIQQIQDHESAEHLAAWREQLEGHSNELVDKVKSIMQANGSPELAQKLPGIEKITMAYETIAKFNDKLKLAEFRDTFNREQTFDYFMFIAQQIEANDAADTAMELWFEHQLIDKFNQHLIDGGHAHLVIEIPDVLYHERSMYDSGEQETVAFEIFMMLQITDVTAELVTQLGTDDNIRNSVKNTLKELNN